MSLWLGSLVARAALTWTVIALAVAGAGEAAHPAVAEGVGRLCVTAADCNLNGDCNEQQRCHCDAGWSGPDCGVLKLGPVDRDRRPGVANATQATWGASPIQAADGRWHLFHAQMLHSCDVFQAWLTNSYIARSVSTTESVGGPYTFEEVVVPAFAHNPQVRALPDGTFVLFFIGGWPEQACHCMYPTDNTSCPAQNTSGLSPMPPASWPGTAGRNCTVQNWTHAACSPTMPGPSHDVCGPNLNGGCGLAVVTAASLAGPWSEPTAIVIDDQWEAEDNIYCAHTNPSPLILPNGTILLAFNAGSCGGGEMIGVAVSHSSWKGPWRLLNKRSIFPGRSVVSGNGHAAEDPFLWKTTRGYHMLLHNFAQLPGGANSMSAYGYSVDGVSWTLSPTPPYNCTVTFTDGTAIDVRRGCERPQLALVLPSDLDSDPLPIGLFTGGESSRTHTKPGPGPLPGVPPSGCYTVFRPILP